MFVEHHTLDTSERTVNVSALVVSGEMLNKDQDFRLSTLCI